MSLSSETEAELSDFEEEADDIDNDIDLERKDSPVHNRPKLPIKSKKNKRKRVKSNYEVYTEKIKRLKNHMPSAVSISSDIHAATPVTPVARVDHINIAAKHQMMSPNFLPREQTRQLALQSVAHLSEICDSDWNSFLQKVKQLDQSFMEQCRLFLSGHEEEFTMRTLPREVAVIDKMCRGRSGVPDGMVPVTATGNGDCLFNSVGKLLFGTEVVSPILRLVTVVDSIQHVEHYLSEFRDHYITTDDAYQMVYSLSTLAVYSRRPTGKKTTASDILRFAIRSEIMEIAKSHSFCGLLQVRYLAGVISRNINLHCPFHPFYHGLMSPCLCQANVAFPPINILFISTGSSSFPNHYVPLIWKIGQRSVVNELPRTRGDIMRDINSIKNFFPETTSILQWPQIVLKPKSSEVTVILTLFDLFCIHSYGLSTSAVEFYIKLLQNNIVKDCGIFVSNVFQANKVLTDKEAMKNPRCVFPRDRLLDSSIVIFPCAQRENWHWVAFVFSLSDEWMCVLDSMNAQSATNRRYLNTFKEYLQHLQRHEGKEVTDFFELDSKVPLQGLNQDCGLYMLYYIESMMKQEYNVEQNTTIEIKDSFNFAERTRQKIIRQIYNLSKTS
eukprot:gene8569-9482_t